MAYQNLCKSSIATRLGRTRDSFSLICSSNRHPFHPRHASPSFSSHLLSSLSSSTSCFLKAYTILSPILLTATRTTSLWFLQQHPHHDRSSLWCLNYSNATNASVDTGNEGLGKSYLELTDEELMRQCDMDTFKSSGPGGQHRNKRESAVRLKHISTGIIAQAAEDRSQHKNRASALTRLRALIALKGTLWISMLIHHLKSFCKYSLLNHPLEDQIVVLELDQTTQNLSWECKLCWISFLQLRDLSQKLQSFSD